MSEELQSTFQSDFYKDVLKPLPGKFVCGEGIEYDPLFITLQSKMTPKIGAEYGDFVETTEPVNWREIENDCLELLTKSKHVRLIILLIRSRSRQIGLFALEEGLMAMYQLLKDFPNEVHPQLYDEGEFEPFMRANAISELDDIDGFLLDLRQLTLPKINGLQLTVKEIERAFAIPKDENSLAEESVVGILNEWRTKNDKTLASLNNAAFILDAIKKLARETLENETPTLPVLTLILALFNKDLTHSGNKSAAAAAVAESENSMSALVFSDESPDKDNNNQPEDSVSTTTETVVDGDTTTVTTERIVYREKVINTRQDALEKIREARAWFQQTEPGNPIILLLTYAEGAAGKNFVELSKLFPADMLAILDINKEM
ncbi:ImpA family type VI secretion system protein [Morganella psychrotolerans]|uniref:type VI secretion system protein TssA n=1 Tax=Morganella psychrotolerans TaxID=368603 RepID=UPI0039AECA1E